MSQVSLLIVVFLFRAELFLTGQLLHVPPVAVSKPASQCPEPRFRRLSAAVVVVLPRPRRPFLRAFGVVRTGGEPGGESWTEQGCDQNGMQNGI